MNEQPVRDPLRQDAFKYSPVAALRKQHNRSLSWVERQAIKLELARRRAK